MMRLNRYADALGPGTPCLGMSRSLLYPERDRRGRLVPGSDRERRRLDLCLPDHAADRKRDDDRRRRQLKQSEPADGNIILTTSTVGSALEGAGVIGLEDITLENNADIRVGVGTNGNVSLTNNSTICGNIRHGVGKKATFTNNSDQCSGYGITEGNQSLPPVSSFMPTDVATNNSNFRLVKCTSTNVPVGCESDSYVANGNKGFTSTVPWNPSTRTISTANNSTLTLSGGDYFVCRWN